MTPDLAVQLLEDHFHSRIAEVKCDYRGPSGESGRVVAV